MNTMTRAHALTRVYFNNVKNTTRTYAEVFRNSLRFAHGEVKRIAAVAVKMVESVMSRTRGLDRDSLMSAAMVDCTRIAGEHGVAMLEKQFRNGV